ncbi:hypothetical protein MC885_019906, partial [Smutsia gigantea]
YFPERSLLSYSETLAVVKNTTEVFTQRRFEFHVSLPVPPDRHLLPCDLSTVDVSMDVNTELTVINPPYVNPFFGIVLVLLASTTVFSLELKPVLFQQRVNRESLKLLNKLKTPSIQQCLPHRKIFLLPHQYQNPPESFLNPC